MGYLVPPDYLTKASREFVTKLRRTPVLVDNGKFDEVNLISTRLASEAAGVHTGRASRPQLDALLRRVESETSLVTGMSLDEQLSLGPTGVVGAEIPTASVLLRLHLDSYVDGAARARLGRSNATVARAAALDVSSHTELSSGAVTYYPVASAFDHDSAVAAGRAFAREDLSAVAMGFGAYMADDAFTDEERINGRTVKFPVGLPRRYLRTQLVALGFWQGWLEVRDSPPAHFHFLGLGAPIMLALTALATQSTEHLSFDATSPIKDAVAGTIYLDRPAPLKSRTRSLVRRILDSDNYHWDCPCPFCKAFLQEHAFDPAGASAWRARNPNRELTAADLAATSPLGKSMLLFSEPKGGTLRKDVDRARIGHNHWILQRLCRSIERAQSSGTLRELVTSQAENYAIAAESSRYSRAVQTALDLT
jgi:hypothetical protein